MRTEKTARTVVTAVDSPPKEAGLSVCVIVPTYNNCRTLAGVLESARQFVPGVLAVNDGSTDGTREILNATPGIEAVHHEVNLGKGAALSSGFARAAELGFTHAITMDADAQHFAEDLPAFLAAVRREPAAIWVGARDGARAGQPRASRWANRLSDFWFWLETRQRLPDTQCGFRAYPLAPVLGLKLACRRYDYEIEVLVKAAWLGVNVRSLPVRVRYFQGAERVSHFQPLRDFLRISRLNFRLFGVGLVVPRGWRRALLSRRP